MMYIVEKRSAVLKCVPSLCKVGCTKMSFYIERYDFSNKIYSNAQYEGG